MPNYEYKCADCDTSEEHYRAFGEQDNFPNCQYCQKEMARVWSANPVQFKGTGFYSTGG